MYQDYKDLLSAFHAHGVRYLIGGGYAVIFHAQPRYTKDMDFFIKADAANAQATHAALGEFGAALEGIARTNSQIAAASFDLDAIRKASIFSPTFRASIMRPPGSAGLKG
jgi:hypothetical protein